MKAERPGRSSARSGMRFSGLFFRRRAAGSGLNEVARTALRGGPSGLVLAGLALPLMACTPSKPPPPPPPRAGYVTIHTQPVAVPVEMTGRTTSFEVAEVRPQVSGTVQQRSFVEGALVTAGQPLYLIDPSPYQAAVDQARANLQSAQAALFAARAQADRYHALTASGAVGRQEAINQEASAREARASVAQNRAALDRAMIDLRRTRVPAPISGRISRSLVTVGALVTAGQTDPMARIERLDPIYVDVNQPSSAVLTLRRALQANGVTSSGANVTLTLPDGSQYDRPGRIEFSEIIVNPNTGTVTLRAVFPNPDGVLYPGMFVRAHMSQKTLTQGMLVPQPGVTRAPNGVATVLVIGTDNRAHQRHIVTDATIGQYWLVSRGLKPGDRVITEGLLGIRPGDLVRPVHAGPMPPTGPVAGGSGGNQP